MHILIIEDNVDFAANLVDFFDSLGYRPDAATDGLTGLHLAFLHDYDVILLDLGLPGLGGVELCKRLRQGRVTTPIIMLTAHGELADKLLGLGCGADDYVVKPVALSELEARAQALVRRARGDLAQSRLRIADLELDKETFEVFRAGTRIHLTRVDFELLKVLMRESPKVVLRERLESEVWGDGLPESDTLRAHIHRLRKAIDRPFRKPLLQTIHGVGYRLAADDALSP
jgi:DNA-binding response OmpR family regulator